MNQKYADLIDRANGKTGSAKIVKLMEKKITDPATKAAIQTAFYDKFIK